MELRGFDDYEVRLGDELRGERATLGKTIRDAELDLRIKAGLLLGIENCDLDAFPNRSVVAGYVRSYARYLKLDPETVYARFCAETGFEPPMGGLSYAESRSRSAGPARSGARMTDASPFDQSRFAVPPARRRFAARVSLGSVVSGFALLALMAGLSYGGYALLQNFQRVGFAPLPEAPDVVAEAPEIRGAEPGAGAPTGARPDVTAYDTDGQLAGVTLPDDLPPVVRRDGPISAIDPGSYGVFAAKDTAVAPRVREREAAPRIDSADAAIAAARRAAAAEAAAAKQAEPAAPVEVAEAPRGIAIQVTDKAWIRIRNEARDIVFEGILGSGQRFDLPERLREPSLRAGNSGAVYVRVDGEIRGPLGPPGGVVKNIALSRDNLRTSFPMAEASGLEAEPGGETATAALDD